MSDDLSHGIGFWGNLWRQVVELIHDQSDRVQPFDLVSPSLVEVIRLGQSGNPAQLARLAGPSIQFGAGDLITLRVAGGKEVILGQLGGPVPVLGDGQTLDDWFSSRTDTTETADTPSTTNLATPVIAYQKSYALPAGSWSVIILGLTVLRRSVSGGGLAVRATLDGISTGEKRVNNVAANSYVTQLASIRGTGKQGSITYSIDYRGGGVAGTTYVDNASLTYFAWRTA